MKTYRPIIAVIFYFILSAFCISCAPLHIKEHQVENVKGRCGLGSSDLYSKYHGTQLAQFGLSRNKKTGLIEFSGAFWGVLGKTILVSNDPVRLNYANGKQISVPAQLISRQFKNERGDSPKETSIPIGLKHTFAVKPGYLDNFVILHADFEFLPADFELNLPRITIDDKVLEPISIKFKFVDRWTFVPLNGC